MWYQLEQFVAKIRNHYLRELVEAVLEDEEISKLLHIAPAAQSLHHAYLGGLLEHLVSLCTLCELVKVRYFWLDRDLLTAGAIVHDIGKIYELSTTGLSSTRLRDRSSDISALDWPCCSRRPALF